MSIFDKNLEELNVHELIDQKFKIPMAIHKYKETIRDAGEETTRRAKEFVKSGEHKKKKEVESAYERILSSGNSRISYLTTRLTEINKRLASTRSDVFGTLQGGPDLSGILSQLLGGTKGVDPKALEEMAKSRDQMFQLAMALIKQGGMSPSTVAQMFPGMTEEEIRNMQSHTSEENDRQQTSSSSRTKKNYPSSNLRRVMNNTGSNSREESDTPPNKDEGKSSQSKEASVNPEKNTADAHEGNERAPNEWKLKLSKDLKREIQNWNESVESYHFNDTDEQELFEGMKGDLEEMLVENHLDNKEYNRLIRRAREKRFSIYTHGHASGKNSDRVLQIMRSGLSSIMEQLTKMYEKAFDKDIDPKTTNTSDNAGVDSSDSK